MVLLSQFEPIESLTIELELQMNKCVADVSRYGLAEMLDDELNGKTHFSDDQPSPLVVAHKHHRHTTTKTEVVPLKIWFSGNRVDRSRPPDPD